MVYYCANIQLFRIIFIMIRNNSIFKQRMQRPAAPNVNIQMTIADSELTVPISGFVKKNILKLNYF